MVMLWEGILLSSRKSPVTGKGQRSLITCRRKSRSSSLRYAAR